MTTAQLEKMDIYSSGMRLHPRRYIVPCIGECTIPENWTAEDIFTKVYQMAFEEGVEEGKNKKAEEIRNCLNI